MTKSLLILTFSLLFCGCVKEEPKQMAETYSETAISISATLKDTDLVDIKDLFVLCEGMVSYLERNDNLPQKPADIFILFNKVNDGYVQLNKDHPFSKKMVQLLEEKGFTDPKKTLDESTKQDLIIVFKDLADSCKIAAKNK